VEGERVLTAAKKSYTQAHTPTKETSIMAKKKWTLGTLKGTSESVRLEDFTWDCDWYWGGGYVGNNNFHCHFDGCFLNTVDSRGHSLNSIGATFLDPWQPIPAHCDASKVHRVSNGASVWEPLSFFLDNANYNEQQWWRIKDLFKQFYALRDAAEVFRYGGHCSSNGRTPAEINLDMAASINKHIGEVIIHEIRKALDKTV
jgi:hypothetical protein